MGQRQEGQRSAQSPSQGVVGGQAQFTKKTKEQKDFVLPTSSEEEDEAEPHSEDGFARWLCFCACASLTHGPGSPHMWLN